MFNKNKRKMQGKGCVPGVEVAVDGGAAVAWLVDGGSGRRCCCFQQWRKILLPPFSFGFFCSQWLSVLGLVLVFFFLVSVSFFSVCFCSSLSLRVDLSLSFSLQVSRVLPLSLRFFFFIYRGSTGGGPWLVRLQSRMAGRLFRWWWGRGERRGRIFEIFSSSVLLKRGEGGR